MPIATPSRKWSYAYHESHILTWRFTKRQVGMPYECWLLQAAGNCWVIMALKMLLVKVALSDIGFVLGVTEATVLEWLRRAAQQAAQINAHLLRNLPVTQVQTGPARRPGR